MGAHSVRTYKSKGATSSHKAVRAAGIATAAASFFGFLGTGIAEATVPTPAATADLDAIASCESSGNPRASNSTHFGLFQFDYRTWASVGGTGDPRNASVSEQYTRAQALMNSRGTQPWAASAYCWSGKSAPSPVKAVPAPTPAPVLKKAVPVPTPTPEPTVQVAVDLTVDVNVTGGHKVVKGDNLWDIANAYQIKGGSQAVFNLNRNILTDPDKIYPGQVLRLKI